MKILLVAPLLLAGLAGLVPTASAVPCTIGNTNLVCVGDATLDSGGTCPGGFFGYREEFTGVAVRGDTRVGMMHLCAHSGAYNVDANFLQVMVAGISVLSAGTVSINGDCFLYTNYAEVAAKSKVCTAGGLLHWGNVLP